ncbi:AbgT family transporter [Corynebacterium diphtheriae]|uniref:AbgT family transporter n=1 Tax=Corynebacterium diphtheriae TaxID=1717 RepID=UPI000893F598|nr:AbgT family transporter [Corynebacterium diphtheriae]OWN36278.1 hypothetical protein AY488_01895 [Corynebacterium belfantii]MBG9337145.1 AbgT family transporter [Corynebacterium diphtheriae bv. mitis]MBG9359597.1 AbgT family transporter [Corynebacterium diphtheriae bv. mitis]MBG9361800.1 AbgT family transporter [Corynebacterium diphtheriae bv. mitis]MBG9363926.1 AbgT family transporter [Corynebacterium diphtheriae bv. mitis]
MSTTTPPHKTAPSGFLGKIEQLGNRLPDPFWIFAFLAIIVAISSWIGSAIGMTAVNPQDGSTVEVTNLLTKEGATKMVSEAVNNFVTFPPLGVIITVMLGVSVAEHSGFISALVRAMVAKVGPKTLTYVVALAGVTGSIASDAVYVMLIPLGAMSFRALGRSPIVGAMVAFAASSAGFNASLILNITDVLLSGISTSAAQLVDPEYHVSPLANYFFVVASSLVLALIITAVTELFVKNKARQLVDHNHIDHSELSFRDDDHPDPSAKTDEELAEEIALHSGEIRALTIAGAAFIGMLAVYFALLFVPASPFYSEESAMSSPLVKAVTVPISLMFLGLGVVYGITIKSITSLGDIPAFMAKGLTTLIPMVVLFFMVSQFLAWFQWSNLGIWTAIKGAELLQRWDLPIYVLFAAVVLAVALLNLTITSGSAQWALMAPVIVPMMMYVGISPEVTQMLFRIGDSPTNIITPMSPYFALALTYLQRYYKPAGVGTLVSLALPYSIAMLVGWFVFFIIWYALGIPLGPGTPMHFQQG